MKDLIYLLIFCLFLISCDNQIMDPNDGDDLLSNETVIGKIVTDNYNSPIKKTKITPMVSEYVFNPNLPRKNCGGFLNNVEYTYLNPQERILRNLKIYVPSKLMVDGNIYMTCNMYTINRYEFLSKKGEVLEGNTWGRFEVHTIKDEVFVEDKPFGSYEEIAVKIKEKIGPLLLKGEFRGEIQKQKTVISLEGRGLDVFNRCKLIAVEDRECKNGKFCWSSKITGNLKTVEYVNE